MEVYLPHLLYQGTDSKEAISREMWNEFYCELASAIFEEDCKLIEDWENTPQGHGTLHLKLIQVL